MSDSAVDVLVSLLDRVRARSRSAWPPLVDASPDDEAVGHTAFAELEASADDEGSGSPSAEDVLVESSPRIKLAAPDPSGHTLIDRLPALDAVEPEHGDADDAPLLEVLGERALGDVGAEEVADSVPLLEHLSLGELLEASLALRPRRNAW